MTQKPSDILLWFAMFSFLAGIVMLLNGCAVEGAGFTNNGRHAKPVVCREIRPGYTQCRSE
jgi:hypothetical protein